MKKSRISEAALFVSLSATILLLGCSDYMEQDVNSWLKVRVRTPVHAGIIGLGPSPHTWGYAKIDGRWKLVGEGDRASFLRLGNDTAALIGFSDETHSTLFLMKLGNPHVMTPSQLLPHECSLDIPPTGERIDCVVGQEGSLGVGYRRILLTSLNLEGQLGDSRIIDAPDVGGRPGRFVAGIVSYYDLRSIPYFRLKPFEADWHGPWFVAGVFPEGLRVFPEASPEGEEIIRGLLRPRTFLSFP